MAFATTDTNESCSAVNGFDAPESSSTTSDNSNNTDTALSTRLYNPEDILASHASPFMSEDSTTKSKSNDTADHVKVAGSDVWEYARDSGMDKTLKRILDRVIMRFTDAQIRLSSYSDPEFDDQYLQGIVRVKHYGDDFIDCLEAIQCEYDSDHEANSGYLVLTTDFVATS